MMEATTTTTPYIPAPAQEAPFVLGLSSADRRVVDKDIPSIVRVGLNKIVVVREVDHGPKQTDPCFSYKDGKPRQLLVLDSTWNALVFQLDKYYKDVFAQQEKAQVVPVMVFWATYFLVRFLGELYFPKSGIAELSSLLVVGVFAVYVAFVLRVDDEELMIRMLKNEEMHELFARDGYSITVERHPSKWGPCGRKPVGLCFERQPK